MLEMLLRQSREQGGTGMYLGHDILEMLYEEVSKGLTRVWEANNARDDALLENRRLRWLCKSAFECVKYGQCEECRITFGGCTLRTAMRDLGVEVVE